MEKASKLKFANEMRNNSDAALLISLNNVEQSAEGFNEIVEVIINSTKIKKVTLIKADTLQRFNEELKLLSDDTFREKYPNFNNAKLVAKEEGLKIAQKNSTEWDNNIINKQAIEKLKTKKEFSIKSWDYYRNLNDRDDGFEEGFEAVLQKLKDDYLNDKNFKREINDLSNLYYKKLQLKARNNELEYFLGILREFIYEDAAVLILMSRDTKLACDYELYRGKRNIMIQWFYEKYGFKLRMKPSPIILSESKREEKKLSKGDATHYMRFGMLADTDITKNNEIKQQQEEVSVNVKSPSLEITITLKSNRIDEPAKAEFIKNIFASVKALDTKFTMLNDDDDNGKSKSRNYLLSSSAPNSSEYNLSDQDGDHNNIIAKSI